jgi:hypothetical protein
MRLYPPKGSDDPFGRKKHCYVNCMSTRIHTFNPAIPIAFSVGKEVADLAFGFGSMNDSIRDLGADALGITGGGVPGIVES